LIDEKVVICQTKISIMSKKIIHTTAAPGAIGPYSQAIQTGNLLFVSGQIPINPATNELVMDNIQDETKQVMENLKAVLSAANVGFENIVKTTIFLSDMNLFAAVNEVYGSYFTGDYPARETVAVKGLPKGVNVEISVIAFV
jgi:2-iminobutanoate/2-iminopropanoate deaminase